jgi:hypothetical protein
MRALRRQSIGALAASAALIAAAQGGLCGCASEVPRRSISHGAGGVGDPGIAAAPAGNGTQGRSWEAVFLPATTVANLEWGSRGAASASRAAPELARLDDDLPVRRDTVLLATNQWPAPLQPSIEHTRRVFLPRDANSALFFLPRRGWWPRDRWGGRGEWGRDDWR